MVRCAIYTRTHFGSDTTHTELHIIQRMAARTFIARREQHGWKCVRTYQDVGQSGVHLDRPTLTQLLADIAAGHIDCVVVESLDRLSRSLADLRQLAGVFQQHRVMLITVWAGSVDSSPADSSPFPFIDA